MLLFMLNLNCFQHTTTVYNIQDQQLQLKGTFNSGLTNVDKQSCVLFENILVYAEVQIGDIIFRSTFKIYDGAAMAYDLTLFSGSLDNIDQYSVAIFQIITKDNSIQQIGTSTSFSIRVFDRRNCFKTLELLYNEKDELIIIAKTPQIQCDFTADGPVVSSAYYNNYIEYVHLIEQNLPDTYIDWFTDQQQCTDEICLLYMDDFLTEIFPKGFYNIQIEQKMSKTLTYYNESGNILTEPFDLIFNLTIRQPIQSFRTQYTIPSVSNVKMRPLYKSVEISQTLNISEDFTFMPGYESFLITFCIADEHTAIDGFFCFRYPQKEAILYPSVVYNCEIQQEFPVDDCMRKLERISNLPSSTIGILWYETMIGDEIHESFSYHPQLDRNPYYPIDLLLITGQACVLAVIKEDFTMQQVLHMMKIEWEIDGKTNVIANTFLFPNEQESYCFNVSVRELENLQKAQDITIFIGNEYLFVNVVQKLLPLNFFVYGFISFIIQVTIAGICLNLIMWQCYKRQMQ